MTNIGSQYILDLAGDDSRYEEMRNRVMEAMRASFRPEFLNRIDEIIISMPYRNRSCGRLCSCGCKTGTTTERRKMSLKLSDAALDF